MLTYEIQNLLEQRNYIIKKASELNALIDVKTSTQIKAVSFDPKTNNYYIKIVEKDETFEYNFHAYTIEEYRLECIQMGLVPDESEQTPKQLQKTNDIYVIYNKNKVQTN